MSDDIPNLPGFDVPLALRQLGNNVKLYAKLLDQFQKSYESSPKEIADAVASDDFETAQRVAHTIKGLAGSLGATGLQGAALNLEKCCKEKDTGAEFDAALAAFSDGIKAAVSSIRKHLAPAAPVAAAPAVDKGVLAGKLAALSANIDDNDARALMFFDEIRPQLDSFDKIATVRLAAAFESFDFSAAAEVVAKLRSALG